MKAELKVKLEMAKFLQQTLDDMSLESKGHSSEKAKEFAAFFHKVRLYMKKINIGSFILFPD
jgi:LETM1 and EF-hand domain-containing protein 1